MLRYFVKQNIQGKYFRLISLLNTSTYVIAESFNDAVLHNVKQKE